MENLTDNTNQNSINTINGDNEKKRLKLFGVEVVYLYFTGIILAFIGWLAENLARVVSLGIIDSRFHILPFISPYGSVVFAIHLVLGTIDDLRFFGKPIFKKKTKMTVFYSNLVSFAIICGCVFAGELAVGNIYDKFFGVQLWNYNSLPLHITQYAGLLPTLGYGLGVWIIFKFVYSPFLKFLQTHLNFKVAKIIDLTLGVLIVLDTLRMILSICILHEAPMLWSINLR